MARVVRLAAVVPGSEQWLGLWDGPNRTAASRSPAEPVVLELTLRFEVPRGAAELPELTVGPDARWFRVGAGPSVDLARSSVLRRLLGALVEARRQRPGVPMSRDELVRACWPGLALGPRQASDRLRATVATLRRKGLRGILQHAPSGWRLAPAAPAALADALALRAPDP